MNLTFFFTLTFIETWNKSDIDTQKCLTDLELKHISFERDLFVKFWTWPLLWSFEHDLFMKLWTWPFCEVLKLTFLWSFEHDLFYESLNLTFLWSFELDLFYEVLNLTLLWSFEPDLCDCDLYGNIKWSQTLMPRVVLIDIKVKSSKHWDIYLNTNL